MDRFYIVNFDDLVTAVVHGASASSACGSSSAHARATPRRNYQRRDVQSLIINKRLMNLHSFRIPWMWNATWMWFKRITTPSRLDPVSRPQALLSPVSFQPTIRHSDALRLQRPPIIKAAAASPYRHRRACGMIFITSDRSAAAERSPRRRRVAYHQRERCGRPP